MGTDIQRLINFNTMKLVYKYFSMVFIVTMALPACKKNEGGINKNPDVYIAGEINNGITNVAKYWKSPAAITLTDGSNIGIASGIVVHDRDVYVSGTEYIRVGTRLKREARYWKNGFVTNLSDDMESSANGIALMGSDVYVAGFVNNGINHVACYWKNGVVANLTDGAENAAANAIAIRGGDVYIAGHEGNMAKYWKNGVPVHLTNGVNKAAAKSITVSGQDVYVAGFEKHGNIDVAKYWKNGIAFNLTDGTGYARANGVAVEGSDVYVVGVESDNGKRVARLWKNGTSMFIGEGAWEGEATAVAVWKNDVHVVGYNYVPYLTRYWKNGIVVEPMANLKGGFTALALN
jgi:Predicted integral membrane proteins containing uncharacterized repeats